MTSPLRAIVALEPRTEVNSGRLLVARTAL